MRFYIKNSPILKKKLLKTPNIWWDMTIWKSTYHKLRTTNYELRTTNLRDLYTNLTRKLRELRPARSLMFYIKRRFKMCKNSTLRQNFRGTKEWMAKPMLPSYPAPFHRFSRKKWKKLLERIFHKVQKTSFLSQKWWF